MASAGQKLALIFIGVMIAAVLFVPIQGSVNSGSGDQTVTNETVTAVYDTPVDLANYEIDASTVTVYNNTDDEVPSADYSINERPGEINVSSSSTAVGDGEEIKVTYTYAATSGNTTTVVTLIPLFAALLILVTMAAEVNRRM